MVKCYFQKPWVYEDNMDMFICHSHEKRETMCEGIMFSKPSVLGKLKFGQEKEEGGGGGGGGGGASPPRSAPGET